MICGHLCSSRCHIINKEHESDDKSICLEFCQKVNKSCNHRCMQYCHFDSECGPCSASVEKIVPACGHSINTLCGQDSLQCNWPCQKLMKCGHACKSICSVRCDEMRCDETIDIEGPCGHTIQILCAARTERSKWINTCKHPCNTTLICGHACTGNCGQCYSGRLHTGYVLYSSVFFNLF